MHSFGAAETDARTATMDVKIVTCSFAVAANRFVGQRNKFKTGKQGAETAPATGDEDFAFS